MQIDKLDFSCVFQHCQLVEIVANGFLLPQDFLQPVQNHNAFSKAAGDHIIALTHVRLRRFPAYRFQILFRDANAKLFVLFHVSSVSIEVGTGFCPQTAFGREPVCRRLAKCDAGSFVGTSSISFASAQSAKAHPFRCASSQNRNRAAGLRFCFLRTLAQRWLFPLCRAHTRRLGRKPHTAATRASRRGAGARRTHRVNRAVFFTGGKSALSARLREIHRFPLLR